MTTDEVEELRKAADEVWDIARKLEQRGYHDAANFVKNAADDLHHRGRLASLPLINK